MAWPHFVSLLNDDVEWWYVYDYCVRQVYNHTCTGSQSDQDNSWLELNNATQNSIHTGQLNISHHT